MSRIALSGSAAGAGTFTLAAPNSDNSYTLNLPQVSGGTLVSTDASGNLGLGVTPSATSSTYKNIQNGGAVLMGKSGAVDLYLNANATFNSGWKYIYDGVATKYSMNDTVSGGHTWFTAPSGTAGNAITFTQAMTLSAAGSLGIGTTTPTAKLDVIGAIHLATSDLPASITRGGLVNYYNDAGTYTFDMWNWEAGNVRFGTNSAERMRIDSTGNVMIGTTDTNDNGTAGLKIRPTSTITAINCTFNSSNAGSTYQLYNLNASFSGYRFYVNYNGGIVNYQTYNVNLSDERSKKNIEPAKPYLSILCSIPVKLFHYKDEPDDAQKNLGVIAQDVEQVAPELISNEGFGELPEDGIPLKTIYETDLKYAMLKAIQELKAELDALKAEIAALKSA